MDAVLTKVVLGKDAAILTIRMPKDQITVDLHDFIDEQVNVTIPDEKEA